MKTGNTLLGILGAVAAGAILGVLFAPDKGKHTRKKISDKSKDCGDQLKSTVEGLVDTLASSGKELVEEGKSKINQAKQDFNNIKEDVKDEVKAAKANY